VKTRFVSKVIIFEKVLEFKKVILLCYGQQKTTILHQKVPKVEVWVIAKTFTCVLNHVVIAYVMNQSRGHWLLSNVYNTRISLTLILEAKIGHATNVFYVLDPFDVEIFIFQNNMRAKVVKAIKPFLQYLEAYDSHQMHNMLVLMLDFRFKSLRVVENYVGCGACICFDVEYDANVIILILMTVFEVLNLIIQTCAIKVIGSIAKSSNFIEKENNIFDVGASMEESSHTLVFFEAILIQEVIYNSYYMC
jgi:hypothetical protein